MEINTLEKPKMQIRTPDGKFIDITNLEVNSESIDFDKMETVDAARLNSINNLCQEISMEFKISDESQRAWKRFIKKINKIPRKKKKLLFGTRSSRRRNKRKIEYIKMYGMPIKFHPVTIDTIVDIIT